MMQQFHSWVQKQREWKGCQEHLSPVLSHCSTVHTGPEMEAMGVFIHRFKDKKKIWYGTDAIQIRKRMKSLQPCWHRPLILALWMKRQSDLCEVEASPVHIVIFRLARDIDVSVPFCCCDKIPCHQGNRQKKRIYWDLGFQRDRNPWW